jgi:hypothetical protein
MTAGPGNTGLNNYPATIAISAAGPSVAAGSAINFPRAAVPPSLGISINNPGVTQVDNTEFLLANAGVYRVTWHISVDEPAQFSLWVGAAAGQAPGGQFSPVTVNAGVPSQAGRAGLTEKLQGFQLDLPVQCFR